MTDRTLLNALRGRLAELPGESDFTLPVAMLKNMVADLDEAASACEQLDKLNRRIDQLGAQEPPPKRVVMSDEEWVG